MSTISTSITENIPKISISFRILLNLYLIIPVCLFLQYIDQFYGSYALRDSLPSSPKHFLLFQILFGTPHILASAIVLLSNHEYVRQYRKKLSWMTLAVILFFGVGSLFISYRTFYIIVAIWTVFHVLKQQIGVAQGICRLPMWAFHGLVACSVTTGCFIYFAIFLKNGLDTQQINLIEHIAGTLCLILLGMAVLCHRLIRQPQGKLFLWANVALIVSSFYAYQQGYGFFAILMPRLIHDATAYIFYVTHDYNRHMPTAQNTLYRFSQQWHIPLMIVLPVLSFSLAFILQAYGDQFLAMLSFLVLGTAINKVITVGLLGYFALLHYYTESFTWKHDSPYRRFIRFSK